jgi:hypothetical protein
VRRKCLDLALDGDTTDGIWGGLDFEERTHLCPICHATKAPKDLGCTAAHSLQRLARLVQLQAEGDATVSVSRRLPICAPTSRACMQPRGRSHSTAKAYKEGCRCAAAREALNKERGARPPAQPREDKSAQERFMAFIKVDDKGHWLWTGSKNGSGYGNFWDGKRTVRAHIFAYQAFVGPVPASARLRANPECALLRCVNPECHDVLAKAS